MQNYTKNEKAIIWLDTFDFLSNKKKEDILSIFDEPQDIFECFKNDYSKFQELLTIEQFDKMCKELNEVYLENHIVNLSSKGVFVITFCSENYPVQFFNFPDKPLILYCKGDVSLLDSLCVGIVGTRKPTIYGRNITEKFAKVLASSGLTIVSGLAEGIDAIAHRGALSVGGKTIAVLGGGFDHIYPKTNFNLERENEENGLLNREYAPNVLPANWHYPVRNRIIAGLSKAVVIPEASIKSGSMHTKNYCAEYGIDIYAVPGEITSFSSSGTNAIIKNCQANIALSPEDVLDGLNVSKKYTPVVKNIQLSFEEQTVLNAIDAETHFDEIQIKTKIDTKTLLTLLTTLELNGIIKKLTGNYYCKI
ncbi:MAG: DNA-processing protein DprA [Clostridia bacterium]|nr:DNA-processing protein DprA [Clostridia bacterium]